VCLRLPTKEAVSCAHERHELQILLPTRMCVGMASATSLTAVRLMMMTRMDTAQQLAAWNVPLAMLPIIRLLPVKVSTWRQMTCMCTEYKHADDQGGM